MSAAPATGGGALPRVGWLLACSLWLAPVVFGFGMTSWIGFGLIGILVVRIRWVLLAVAWIVVLSWIGIEPDSLPLFLEGLSHGYVDVSVAAPLLVLYLAGVAYGVHANRVWLRMLHERRVRGVRMLGWAPPAQAAPAASAEIPVAPARDEKAELLARAAGAFRGLLDREQQRMRSLVAAAAEAATASPAALPVTPLPVTPLTAAPPTTAPPTTTPLTTTPLVGTTLLGLPSGPVDVRTASLDEIAAIPAIGSERAAQLVAARETRPITSVEDVVEVLGLTAVDLVRARTYLRF